MFDKRVACCLCVRDCAKYLPKIFNNLERLASKFNNCWFIFVYDNCTDNSENILKNWQSKIGDKVILKEIKNDSYCRTTRIAKARNTCLDIVYNRLKDIEYHIMIDADNVNTSPWKIDNVTKYLDNDEWDSLSFNRSRYYDIWALLYGNIRHHCWGYNSMRSCQQIVGIMANDIKNRLSKMKDGELFNCYSAFNGFAIYKTRQFKDIRYDGTWKSFKDITNIEWRIETLNLFKKLIRNDSLQIIEGAIHDKKWGEHCEHLYYHVSAIQKNNARIRIAKDMII